MAFSIRLSLVLLIIIILLSVMELLWETWIVLINYSGYSQMSMATAAVFDRFQKNNHDQHPDKELEYLNLDKLDYSENITSNELGVNYHLWSRFPSDYNWTELETACRTIINSENASNPAFDWARKWTIPDAHNDSSMAHLLSNCTRFRKLVPFAKAPASEEESEFSLAYVLIGNRNAAQTVRFLRMIYQPQNAYCLSYDKKSPMDYQTVINQLANCFNKNVVLSPEIENIYYSGFSLLHQMLVCMKALLKLYPKIKWRYVQILAWNDFPLKTNREMVKIFKILNGSQDGPIEPVMNEYVVPYHLVNPNDTAPTGDPIRPVLPDGLTLYKGSTATSMSMQFIQFALTNPTSLRLLEWLKYTLFSEEQYWATLMYNVNLNAPGAFPGYCHHVYGHLKKSKPWMSRYQVWYDQRKHDRGFVWVPTGLCSGKPVHYSCVYGVGDIPVMINRPELMAHKMYDDFQPAGLFCMEQWFWKDAGKRMLNETYYDNFPSVRYQRTKEKNKFVC